MDLTATVYLIIIVSQTAIFSMCLWWLYIFPEASTIFWCFMLLSLGIVLNFIPPFYTRIEGPESYMLCRHKWWWVCRHIPIATVSVVILGIFIRRATSGEWK